MTRIQLFQVNLLSENTVLVGKEGTGTCVLVDPGMRRGEEFDAVAGFMSSEGLVPAAVLLTHGHYDHVLGVAPLLELYPDIPVYLHPADIPLARMGAAVHPYLASMPESSALARELGSAAEREKWLAHIRPVSEEEPVEAGGLRFRVIETPGHSPGGVCYLLEEDRILFSGDTLFAGSIGRTDLEGGDYDALIRSVMDKIMGLDGETAVFPGHGGRTTIGREAMTNPFLIPFNEPASEGDDLDPLSLEGI